MNVSSFLVSASAGTQQLNLFNENRFFSANNLPPAGNPLATKCVGLNAPSVTAPSATPSAEPRPRWPRDFGRYGRNDLTIPDTIPSIEGGTCNSVRTGWGFWNGFFPGTNQHWFKRYAPPNFSRRVVSITPPDELFESQFTNVNGVPGVQAWKTWVAIVGDPRTAGGGGKSCAGIPHPTTGVSNADPRIEQIPYEIVGFLRLHLYDLDVSDPPPTFPPNSAPFSQASNSSFMTRAYASGSGLAAYAPQSPPSDPINNSNYVDPNYRWWFNRSDSPAPLDVNGVPTSMPAGADCNVVRARLSCRQPAMPQAGGAGLATAPRLVVE